MSNRHYKLDEEFEVEIKLKVKLHQISNYQHLSENDITGLVKEIKENIGNEIKTNLTRDYIYDDEMFDSFDLFIYSLK